MTVIAPAAPAAGPPRAAPPLATFPLPSVPLVEVMIVAQDEAGQIQQAVANASALGPVFVLDGGSSDETAALAARAGATVVVHPFADFSRQRTWGLQNLPFRGEWLFVLDADERLTRPLIREVLEAAARPPDRAGHVVNGYRVGRRLVFMGRRIRHGGLGSVPSLRLFRRGYARYDGRPVHERLRCTGRVGSLSMPLLHLRNGTLSRYIARQILQADLESDEWLRQTMRETLREALWQRPGSSPRAGKPPPPHVGLLPGRATWRFFSMYFLRLGFLDGVAGWRLARFAANYEYMARLIYWDKVERLSAKAPPSLSCGGPPEAGSLEIGQPAGAAYGDGPVTVKP